MGKISQASAKDAAVKICAPIQKEIDTKRKEIGDYVKSMITAETPDVVINGYKKHPDWFQNTNSLNIQGNGFSYFNVAWVGNIPVKHTYSYDINKENSVGLHKLADQRSDLEKKYKKILSEIENTILALGTHKRVEEEYPEAYPYVADKPTTTALMLNIQPIRQITCALIPGCTTTPAPKTETTTKPKAKAVKTK